MSRRTAPRLALVVGFVLIAAACADDDSGESTATGPTTVASTGDTSDDTTSDDTTSTESSTGTTIDDTTSDDTITAETTTTGVSESDPAPVLRFVRDLVPEGYAGAVGLTGGMGHPVHVVTSAADSGPGTYREALSAGDRIVRFDPALDGSTIRLDGPVTSPASNITIDGSGVDVTISGRATRFAGTNIVVAGMHYADMDATDDQDAITFRDAEVEQHFGLFGNVFERATDGLVDVIWNEGRWVKGSACDNLFRHHDKAMLIDSGDEGEGGEYLVTLCRNHWFDVYQRTPLSRHASVHDFNSVFERYGDADGNGGGSKAGGDGDRASQHLLENNVAIPRRAGESTWDGSVVTSPRAEWAGPQLDSDGAVRVSGSYLVTVDGVTATELANAPETVFTPPYEYRLLEANDQLREIVTANAGTCVPAGRDDAVVPCAPLVVVESSDSVELALADDSPDEAAPVDTVEFVVGTERRPSVPVGDGLWQLDLSDLGLPPTTVYAVATLIDGREVESDRLVISVLG